MCNGPSKHSIHTNDGTVVKTEVEDNEYERQAKVEQEETRQMLREVKIEEPEEEIPTAFGQVEEFWRDHPEFSAEEALYVMDLREEGRKKFWEKKGKERKKKEAIEKKELRRRRDDQRRKENQLKEKKRQEIEEKRLETARVRKPTIRFEVEEPTKKSGRKASTVANVTKPTASTSVSIVPATRASSRETTKPAASTSASSTVASSTVASSTVTSSTVTNRAQEPAKKKAKFTCPECGKAASGGTCFCNGCGEWVHLKCAKVKAKEWSQEWKCSKC